ncbi:MAG: glycosyl hydrolase [Candidatus Aminicenantes bacterium]|nr:glycosyl hydrolase [Candidatus Aminicenantes bacterium]
MRRRQGLGFKGCLAGLALLSLAAAGAQERAASPAVREKPFTEALLSSLEWRNIGPAIMVGRVTDVEGVPGDPAVVYVGTASGGVWKTVDGGVRWKPIFDGIGIPSIGDIALEPGNPEVVYVGTGEANPRNSISVGGGVFKSTDGGATWTSIGLQDTRHISRIVIDPRRPNVVFVGALGNIFGPNKDRGVFRSEDGGRTWEKTLYTDDRHGVADLEIDPRNPNILYAALWRFERKPWTFISGGEEGGLFKSVDGGRTWKKLTRGLPRLVGRIGVKAAPSNPSVVYAMTESPEGTLFRSDDRGETFRLVSSDRRLVSRGFYYTDLRVDPAEENRVYAVASQLFVSIDGGKSFRRLSRSTHVDFHALWIDPRNAARLWQGQDGGIAVSQDRGESWSYVNNLCVSQFYQVFADNREPFYHVGGGLQDNGTWYAPSRTRDTFGILNDDWRMISFGDGFHGIVHPENPDLFLTESQGGSIYRTDMKTGEQQAVSPQMRRSDGGPASLLPLRFNWNAPLTASPFDGKTVYLGANAVLRSQDFGLTWRAISPDLTTDDKEKQKSAGGPAWPENTTAEFHCTIISLKESPSQRGLLWAGTDDGQLHVTADGGRVWQNVVKNVPGIPPLSPVSAVEPSWTEAGTAYCAFDRHMLNDLRPYVYKTRDLGKTWTNITGNLPERAHVWTLKEDLENPAILYAGTEIGLFVSFTGGTDWVRLHGRNLPVVPVHDILIHLRDNDLILGTHGRGIWILDDITPLQQLAASLLEKPASLFDLRPALRFSQKATRYGVGDGLFQGPNPPYGALVTYYLKDKPAAGQDLKLDVLDGATGRVVRTLSVLPTESGLNRVAWDLRGEPPRPRRDAEAEESDFSRSPRGVQVLPGSYRLRLSLGQFNSEKPLEVKLDPTVNISRDDLRAQQKAGLKLVEMLSVSNDALRALDGLESQVEERKSTMQKLGKNVKDATVKAVHAHLEIIRELQGRLARPADGGAASSGSRLTNRLSSLFNALEGAQAAPTAAQAAYLHELTMEFREALGAVNAYLSDRAEKLNAALSDSRLPGVLVPEPLKLPDLEKL